MDPRATGEPATVPVPAPSEAPTEPVPVDEPTLPEVAKVSGRVIVPGAVAPGQKTKPPAPTAPTRTIDRVDDTVPAARTRPAPAPGPRPAPRPARPAPARPRRPGKRRLRRALTALFALVLLAAVPVVSAYVAYKLASGENPFQWPPTIDYDQVFGR
jgi:hypothetical protein